VIARTLPGRIRKLLFPRKGRSYADGSLRDNILACETSLELSEYAARAAAADNMSSGPRRKCDAAIARTRERLSGPAEVRS
jgi:hypothetical protein